jgi:hypothetical protein
MSPKAILAAILALVVTIMSFSCFHGLIGHNDSQNWQVLQPLRGAPMIVDRSGWYFKNFGTVWTYPRTIEAYYSSHPDQGGRLDNSLDVTFNDGGKAKVSSFVRVKLPLDDETRLSIHKEFHGNPDEVANAVRAHLANCIGVSGPIMSASENQASRKAEFNHIIEEQLKSGLFATRRIENELPDLTELEEGVDEHGNKTMHQKKAKVWATEIIRDKDGHPVISQSSPLAPYKIVPTQFSVQNIQYDDQTLAQFAAKKESYLLAEKAKADRQNEVQQRLRIEETGRRQVAEIQAEENQKKERAMIQAQQAADVSVIDKQRAVTDAKRRVEVAEQSRKEAETMKAIARIEAETASLKKQSQISQAEGQQKAIELGGGISEKDRVLAQIKAQRDVEVAKALANVPVPSTVIAGGGSGGGALDNLMQLFLLKQSGVLGELPNRNLPNIRAASSKSPAVEEVRSEPAASL